MKRKTGLGRSNDKGAAVRLEMRAARLALGDAWPTDADVAGYQAHFDGTDVKRGGWAGWLDRELSTHDEQQDPTPGLGSPDGFAAAIEAEHAKLATLLTQLPEHEPPPEWQQRVLAECDRIDEQTRHDVAQSVARHSELEPSESCEHRDSYGPLESEGVCILCGTVTVADAVLDGIDQSEPTTPTDTVRTASRGPRNTDNEATHVGAVDERFEDGDGL